MERVDMSSTPSTDILLDAPLKLIHFAIAHALHQQRPAQLASAASDDTEASGRCSGLEIERLIRARGDEILSEGSESIVTQVASRAMHRMARHLRSLRSCGSRCCYGSRSVHCGRRACTPIRRLRC